MQSTPSARASLVAGALAALGATACCLGPLLLVTLGIGGVWVSGLKALEPLRPVFIGVGVLFFSMAFHRLYIVPRRCAPGETCAVPATLVRQKIVFWILLTIAATMLLFPLYAHWFY